MNSAQKIVLAVGIVIIVLALMFPPAIVPEDSLAGNIHPFVELAPWASGVIHDRGVDMSYFVSELLILIMVTAVGIVTLRNVRARS